MSQKDILNYQSIVHQFFIGRSTVLIANLSFNIYYYILLFRETGSLIAIASDYLLFSIGLYVGFVATHLYIDRIGYVWSLKLSFALQVLSALVILVLLGNIAELFIVFALIRGLTRGTYWPIEHAITLKEMNIHKRGKIFSTIESFFQIYKIIIPVLIGALLSYTDNYSYLLIFVAIVYATPLMIPFSYNKKARTQIRTSETARIVHSKDFWKYGALQAIQSGFTMLLGILFFIIPYLLIQEEFGVGIITSLIGLVAAIVAWFERNLSKKQRMRLGVAGFSIYALFTMFFAVVWTIPALVIRSIAFAFASSLSNPIKGELDYSIRDKILKDYKNESALEMNLVVETLYLLGRMLVVSVFIILLQLFERSGHSSEDFIRLTVFIAAPLFIIFYWGYVRLDSTMKVK